MIKLKDLLNEAETRWSGLSLSDTQIPAVATRQRKDVEKLYRCSCKMGERSKENNFRILYG